MPSVPVSPFVLPEAWVHDRESYRSRMDALAAEATASGAEWVTPHMGTTEPLTAAGREPLSGDAGPLDA